MNTQTSGYTWDDERPTTDTSEWLTTLQFKAAADQGARHSRNVRMQQRRRSALKMLFLSAVLMLVFASIAVHSFARLIYG